jgi:hypothetical protein
MLHPFHFFVNSFGLFVLEQPEMQIRGNIDLKGKYVIRINPQQLGWSRAETFTRFR